MSRIQRHDAGAGLTKTKTASSEGRFCHVFTKLRALELEEFSQVVILDLDLLVMRDISDLFGWKTPAAVQRGNREMVPGEVRDPTTFFDTKTGKRKGGINAGVMVMAPDAKENDRMRVLLSSPTKGSYRGREQEFLTEFYVHSFVTV